MHSFEPNYLEKLAFHADQVATLHALGEYRGKQALYFHQAPETLKRLRDVAIIESTESSNRLEGVIVSPSRLEPLVLKRTDPKNRSEQEVAGYRDTLALIHESAREMPFTGNVMLQLHGLLCRYLPDPGGKWKNANNEIIEKRPDGTERIRFTPTPAHLTPIQIEQLARSYQDSVDRRRQEPLVLVALAILDFLCIHPFRDGNGRVGRLLTLMLLYHFNYEVGRYISLERIIEESKETYYEALEASSRGWHEGTHNVMPWLNYFWGMLLRAYREFEERVGEVRHGRGAKSEQIRLAVLAHSRPFSISDIEADCAGVSRDMVRLILRRMKDEGLIALQGKGRSAKWVLLQKSMEGSV
jgi:Fic family protein